MLRFAVYIAPSVVLGGLLIQMGLVEWWQALVFHGCGLWASKALPA